MSMGGSAARRMLAGPKGYAVKMTATLVLCLALTWLSACTDTPPTCYPLSGKPCAPDDPVHDLRPDVIPGI